MDSPAITPTNEPAIVARAVIEPSAFATLYDHYFPRVYNYVRYRVHDAAVTDDLTAQIFEKALAKLNTYDSAKAPFGAWLFAIARHTVANHRRGQWRWLSLDVLFNASSGAASPEQHIIAQEQQQHLLDAVARLDERERDIIALKFGAELPNTEIADITGLTASNVGVILYRAIKTLRIYLVEDNEA
ncbi:MAG TPA: sigma-70 family RNA polymerase sigma factor [Aggregatilineales bacterium]|nr:sigma-70 family RNA polymerase sigma factor [Aggregatilineales bacterium]